MPKNREVTRRNRKNDAMPDRKNAFGHNDPTPYEAARRILQAEKAQRHERQPDRSI